MSIFVHLSSYRDPELVPSIKDCIAKADHPEALSFGVCWQHTPEDRAMDEFANDCRFRVADMDVKDARGCCYARSVSQSLYRGEDYVLQLDSHHRFEPSWDTTLIGMMKQTGVEKPCITAYAGSYDAVKGLNPCVPWRMRPKPFSKDGSLQFVPVQIDDWEARTSPVPARFASGHFFFTHGRHCLEIPYDPDLYFLGEELVMAVRSFTHGYDLFHPHRLVVHHQYHRDGREKFWGDKPNEHKELDRISKLRVLKLMGMEDNDQDLGKYGLGTVRTLADYERFTGMDFKNRRQHSEAIAASDPPTTFVDAATWEASMSVGRHVLLHWTSDFIELPEDCRFVNYTVESACGKVLWRKDVHEEDNFQAPPIAEFLSALAPANLIVWPYLKSNKWGPKKFSLPLSQQSVYTTY